MINLSIIIPYYKGRDFIFNCIDSILDSHRLSQKKILFEIIVIVDSPKEYQANDMDIIAHYEQSSAPIKVLLNDQNMGVAASRNKGLKVGQYDFVTCIDQDDQVMPNYFAVLEKRINKQDYCIIFNGYRHYTNANVYHKLYFVSPSLSFEALIKEQFTLWTPGMMIFNKKEIQIPNYFIDVSDKYKGTDDWAALINLVLIYPHIHYKYIRTPIFIHNRHTANFSNNAEQMHFCRIAVLEYFRERVDSKKQKIINKLIKIRMFHATKDLKPLSKTEILREYKYIYILYLYNSYGYALYPLFKIRKMLYNCYHSITKQHENLNNIS